MDGILGDTQSVVLTPFACVMESEPLGPNKHFDEGRKNARILLLFQREKSKNQSCPRAKYT